MRKQETKMKSKGKDPEELKITKGLKSHERDREEE